MSALAMAYAQQGHLGEPPSAGFSGQSTDDNTGTMIWLAIGGVIVGTIAGVVISSSLSRSRKAQNDDEEKIRLQWKLEAAQEREDALAEEASIARLQLENEREDRRRIEDSDDDDEESLEEQRDNMHELYEQLESHLGQQYIIYTYKTGQVAAEARARATELEKEMAQLQQRIIEISDKIND